VLVSALPPGEGVEELLDALDRHRDSLDLATRRLASRRAHALSDFVEEHGQRGLRALGGRRAAAALLAKADPALEVPALVAALERDAGV
jgi:LAO/AO transport system kinase